VVIRGDGGKSKRLVASEYDRLRRVPSPESRLTDLF
jgi:hypothetical protein